jgi:hypothetical protein
MTEGPAKQEGCVTPFRWNVGIAMVGLALVAVVLLFPPYRLEAGIDVRGQVRYGCTASVYRYAPMPEALAPTQPRYDAGTFRRRLALVLFAAGRGLRRGAGSIEEPMPGQYEIRADFDAKSIVVYQAYAPEIALPALERQRFVPPFSLQRMTWIKPSFLWLMERSNWGRKPGQEHILAVRITREGWEEALSLGVLTHPDPKVYRDGDDWNEQFERAKVLIQWDPERSLRGAALDHYAIQVGLSRHVIERYVNEWVLEIADYTPLARKVAALLKAGKSERARKLLPKERVYPWDAAPMQAGGAAGKRRGRSTP